MTEKWVEIQGKYDLVPSIGVSLYYIDLAKAEDEAPVNKFLIYFRQ